MIKGNAMETRMFIHFCLTMLFLVLAIALLVNGYYLLTSLFAMMFGVSGSVLYIYVSNRSLHENKVQNQSAPTLR